MVLPERYSLSTPAQQPHSMAWAPNPKVLMAIRIIFTILVCLMALASAIMTAIIINYFLSHRPMVFPPLSSMIFILFMGIFTSIMYFGYYIFLPSLKMMRRGSMMSVLFTMKLEILFQFAMSAIWISGALAYAADYRGHENCQWNGYYHYPKPSNWNHLCDMINWVVGMAYATFGIQAAFLAFDLLVGAYIFMFLDQDSISEPFYEWGNRAWEYKHKPAAPLSSVHNPMLYHANPEARGARMYGPHYDEKYSYDSTLRESYSDKWSRSTLAEHPPNRRGVAYSDPSVSDRMSDESSTLASETRYYGGTYSRSSANSRRAGLAEAPRPAGSGGTSSGGAPSWKAPSVTTDSGSTRAPVSIRAKPRKPRHASAPQSLGSRGRRGTSYLSRDSDTLDDHSEVTESMINSRAYDDNDFMPAGRGVSSRRIRRHRNVDGDDADDYDTDDDDGWHLREDAYLV